MLADELLNPLLPTLKLTDSVEQALAWMEEYRASQLAIVDEEHYRGMLSEEILLDADPDQLIAEIEPLFIDRFATRYQHLYELVRLARLHAWETIPVVEEERIYVGSISRSQLLDAFAEALGTQEDGAVVVLVVEDRDYSLTEVSRLVESNEAKIISSYFTSGQYETDQPGRLTLKLNRRDINPVVATLERFGYIVEAIYASTPIETPDRERLDQLFRYLNL
jgi:acetoin utilization protein AcuB